MNLHGKSAIVTGGAARLGRAMVLALAEAGVNVVIHYNVSEQAAEETRREAEEHGVKAMTVQADLAQAESGARDIVVAATAAFGSVDILVNSAAIFEAGSLRTLSDDLWQRTLAINLAAPAFLCRELAACLESDQPAHIVNIVDWRAVRTDPGHLAYTLSKSGLVSLTRNLALELGPEVQVNGIAPGAILPPPDADDAYLKQVTQQIPLKRAGGPGDVTDALLYLLRSDFVTGEIIHVAGGQQI